MDNSFLVYKTNYNNTFCLRNQNEVQTQVEMTVCRLGNMHCMLLLNLVLSTPWSAQFSLYLIQCLLLNCAGANAQVFLGIGYVRVSRTQYLL